MTSVEVLDPWIEKIVKESLGIETLHRFPDGLIPVGLPNAVAFLRLGVGPGDEPRLWLNAPLLEEVEATPELYEKLNEVNASTDYLRFYWRGGVVCGDMEFVAESCRTEDLQMAYRAVMWHKDNIARLLGIPDAKPFDSGHDSDEDEDGAGSSRPSGNDLQHDLSRPSGGGGSNDDGKLPPPGYL